MEEFLKVRMGEIIESQTDIEYENDSGQTATVEKGEKSIVGFDGFIHFLKQRLIIMPDESFGIKGYSATGLANFLTAWLNKNFDLENIMNKSKYSVDNIRACMEAALVEIGMDGEHEIKENAEKNVSDI